MRAAAERLGLDANHKSNRVNPSQGVTNPMLNELHKPVLEGKGATDYERYLRTDELLSLQTATEELSHPDELTFQVVHQSSELLMKGASWELERARVALTEGNYPNASDSCAAPTPCWSIPLAAAHSGNHHAVRLPHHPRRPGTRQRPGFAGISCPAAHHAQDRRRVSGTTGEQGRLTADDVYRRHEEFFASARRGGTHAGLR